jgi:4-amino-4-deoxy-L-arabinose transferase-like glycosyltransferase
MRAFFLNGRHTSFLVFLLAFLGRGAFILTQQEGFYFPDSLEYSRAAVSLLDFGALGADYDRAPAYPVFLASVYFLFGENIFAVRVVESFIGALLAVIIALIGRRVAVPAVGVLAGITWAIYPLGIFIAGLVYPTNVAALLLACGVYFVLPNAYEDLSIKRVVLAGLFLGLTALTIPVALLTIIAIGAWVCFWARCSRILLPFLLLLGSAVTVLPWTVRNFIVYGQLLPVQPFESYLPIITTTKTDSEADRIDAVWSRLDLYAVRFGRNFVQFWELYPSRIQMSDQDYRDKLNDKDPRIVKKTIYTPNRLINTVSTLSTGPILVFALLGTAGMWLRRDLRRALSLLWFVALSFAIGYSFFVGKIRYRIPVEPYLMILSAYGFYEIFEMISARLNRHWFRALRSPRTAPNEVSLSLSKADSALSGSSKLRRI